MTNYIVKLKIKMKKIISKQLDILKDKNSIPFIYTFTENTGTYELTFQYGLYTVHVWLCFPNDYPFTAPIILFRNLHSAIKHPLLDNIKKVNMCNYCPAIDIRQLIINCYIIFDEIFEDKKNEDLIELLKFDLSI